MSKILLKITKIVAIIVSIVVGLIVILDIATNWRCAWYKDRTEELTERVRQSHEQRVEDSVKVAQLQREIQKKNAELRKSEKSRVHLDSVSLNEGDTFFLLSGKIEIRVSDIMLDKFGSYASVEIIGYTDADTTADSYPRARIKDVIYFPFSEKQYVIHILNIKHDPRPEKVTVDIYEEYTK